MTFINALQSATKARPQNAEVRHARATFLASILTLWLSASAHAELVAESPSAPEFRAGSIAWLTQAIRGLPSDEPVAPRQRGYNNYRTQKEHWLGWLDPTSGTGTYPRRSAPDRDARYVYNHVVEPQMLLWLISASGVAPERVQAATRAAAAASSLAGKSAAIRKQVPWPDVAAALLARESAPRQPRPEPAAGP